MSRSDAHRLADMTMAAAEIAAIVQRGRDAFDEDVVLRRAVERCLEIIGEASKALSGISPTPTPRSLGPTWRRCGIG